MRRLCDLGVTLHDCEHRTPKPSPNGGFPYIAIPDLRAGRIDLGDVRLISEADYESWTRKTRPQAGDVIVTRRGRVGDTAVVPEGLRCAIGQNLVLLRSDESCVSQPFLRWALRGPLYQQQVDKYRNVGAVFDSLNCEHIPLFEIPIPPIEDQRRIAAVLGVFDEKIEGGRRLSDDLLTAAGAIFDAACAESPELALVGDVAAFHNRQRVPLSSRERAEMPGPFPYYGATGIFDYVDRFLFEGVFLLIGEDGSVINDDGTPVSQYVWGRLWVNNHAHVITGAAVTTELAYLALARTDVRAHITGAVQPKLSMGNLKAAPVTIPAASIRASVENAVQPVFDLVRLTRDEVETLSELRDSLLPKLVSGEIRVPDDYEPGDLKSAA